MQRTAFSGQPCCCSEKKPGLKTAAGFDRERILQKKCPAETAGHFF